MYGIILERFGLAIYTSALPQCELESETYGTYSKRQLRHGLGLIGTPWQAWMEAERDQDVTKPKRSVAGTLRVFECALAVVDIIRLARAVQNAVE